MKAQVNIITFFLGFCFFGSVCAVGEELSSAGGGAVVTQGNIPLSFGIIRPSSSNSKFPRFFEDNVQEQSLEEIAFFSELLLKHLSKLESGYQSSDTDSDQNSVGPVSPDLGFSSTNSFVSQPVDIDLLSREQQKFLELERLLKQERYQKREAASESALLGQGVYAQSRSWQPSRKSVRNENVRNKVLANRVWGSYGRLPAFKDVPGPKRDDKVSHDATDILNLYPEVYYNPEVGEVQGEEFVGQKPEASLPAGVVRIPFQLRFNGLWTGVKVSEP